MTSTVWPAGLLLDNLKANLATRFAAGSPEFDDVAIHTGYLSSENLPDEVVFLTGVRVPTEDPAALGDTPARNEERNVVPVEIRIRVPWAGATETEEQAIVRARNRALAIFAEIEIEIRTNRRQVVTTSARQVVAGHVQAKELRQGIDIDRGGRVAQIEADLVFAIRTNVP